MRNWFWLLSLLVLAACAQQGDSNGAAASTDSRIALRRAKNIQLSRTAGGCYRLHIPSAWQAGGEGRSYFMCPSEGSAQASQGGEQRIWLPAQRIVCTSTVQAAMLAFLGEAHRIVGMTDGRYLYNADLLARLQKGDIVDLGNDGTIDYERLVALKPDLVLLFGQGGASQLAEQLQRLEIPHLYIAEYLEEDVLGRAEWLRLMGILVGKEAHADSLYEHAIYAPYETLREQLAQRPQARPEPSVITGVAYEGTWYAAGGRSYIAQLIRDAGSSYLWHADTTRGSLPLSWERAYAEGKGAYFWINVGQVRTLAELRAMDARYAEWEACERERVFNYHKRVSAAGGYDIFESAVVQPHLLLQDLARILRYTNDYQEDSLYYYARLK